MSSQTTGNGFKSGMSRFSKESPVAPLNVSSPNLSKLRRQLSKDSLGSPAASVNGSPKLLKSKHSIGMPMSTISVVNGSKSMKARFTREPSISPLTSISSSPTITSSKVMKHIYSMDLTNIELEFCLGERNLEKHGIHELKASFPIFKHYTQPNLEEMDVVDEILQNWVRQVRVPWSKDEIQGPKSNIKTAIAAAGFFNPKDSITEPAMIAAAGFCLCILYLDDILDKSGSFGGSTSSSSTLEFKNTFLQTVFNILDNKYSSIEELPIIMPSLDPVYKLLYLSFSNGIAALPNFDSNIGKHMRKAFLNDAVAAMLMKDLRYGEQYTDEAYRMLRPRDGGFYTVLELLLLARGITVPTAVRKHLLFKIIMHLSASALGLTNDLLGLEKEIADENDNDNLVLRIVKNEKINIVEAFTRVNVMVQNQRKDIENSCEKLIDEFPEEDETLTEFVDILQTFLDGHVYFSQFSSRYGEFNLTMKKRK